MPMLPVFLLSNPPHTFLAGKYDRYIYVYIHNSFEHCLGGSRPPPRTWAKKKKKKKKEKQIILKPPPPPLPTPPPPSNPPPQKKICIISYISVHMYSRWKAKGRGFQNPPTYVSIIYLNNPLPPPQQTKQNTQ